MKSLHHVSKRTWKAFTVIQLGNGEILISIHWEAIPAILGAVMGFRTPSGFNKKKKKINQLRWVQPAVWKAGRNSSKNSSGRGHLSHKRLTHPSEHPALPLLSCPCGTFVLCPQGCAAHLLCSRCSPWAVCGQMWVHKEGGEGSTLEGSSLSSNPITATNFLAAPFSSASLPVSP